MYDGSKGLSGHFGLVSHPAFGHVKASLLKRLLVLVPTAKQNNGNGHYPSRDRQIGLEDFISRLDSQKGTPKSGLV
jgi:hypothetical protein